MRRMQNKIFFTVIIFFVSLFGMARTSNANWLGDTWDAVSDTAVEVVTGGQVNTGTYNSDIYVAPNMYDGPCNLQVEESTNGLCIVMPETSSLEGSAKSYSNYYSDHCSNLKMIVDDVNENNYSGGLHGTGNSKAYCNVTIAKDFPSHAVRAISFQPEGMPSGKYGTSGDIKKSEEIMVKKAIEFTGKNFFALIGSINLWPDDKHDTCLGDPNDDGTCRKDAETNDGTDWGKDYFHGDYNHRVSELSNWVEDQDVTILDPRHKPKDGEYGDEGFPEFAWEVSRDYRADLVVELDDNVPALVFKKDTKAILRNLKITLRGDKGYIMKIEDGAEVWFERSVIVNERTGSFNQLIKVEKGGIIKFGNQWNTPGYEGKNLFIINEESAAPPKAYVRFYDESSYDLDQLISGVAFEYNEATVPFEIGAPRKYNYQKIGGGTLADGTKVPEKIIDNDHTDDCIFISETECVFSYYATYKNKDGKYTHEGVFADGKHAGVLAKKGTAKDSRSAAAFKENVSVMLERDEKGVLSIKKITSDYKFLITAKGTIHFSNDCGRLGGYHLVGEVCRPVKETGALEKQKSGAYACPYGRIWDETTGECSACGEGKEQFEIDYSNHNYSGGAGTGKTYICIQTCGEGLNNKIKGIKKVYIDKDTTDYVLKDDSYVSDSDISTIDACDCPADKPLEAKDGACTTQADEDKKCKDAAAKTEDGGYWAYDSVASDCKITCPEGQVTTVTADGKKTCEGEVTCDETLSTKLDNKCVCKYKNADAATCKCPTGTHAEGFGPFATCVADSGSCTNNLECGAGKICSSSKCVDEGSATCASDADCGSDKLCKDGLCVNDGGEKVVKGLGSECGGSKVCAEGMTCNDKAKCECDLGGGWSYSDITFSCVKANIGKEPAGEGEGETTKEPAAKVTKGGDCSLVPLPMNASQAASNAIPYLIILLTLGFIRNRCHPRAVPAGRQENGDPE